MSDLPHQANKPRNYDALREAHAAAEIEDEASKERGDRDKGDGRGEATAHANPKLAPGDEVYQVVKGAEHEQAQLQAVSARNEAQHGPSDGRAGFLLAVTAYGAERDQPDAPAPTQTRFPEESRNEITQPGPEAAHSAEVSAIGAYQARGNPYSLRAEQSGSDPMASLVTPQDRAEQAAEREAQRPDLDRQRARGLEIS